MNTNTNTINKYKDYLYPEIVNTLQKKMVNQPVINVTNHNFKSSSNLYKRLWIKFEINDSKNFKYKYQELYLYSNNILYRNLNFYDFNTRRLIHKKKELLKKLNINQMKKIEFENNILNEEIEKLNKTIAKLQKKIKHM